MIDLTLTNDNDITFAPIDGEDCVKQMIYHAVMTRYGELERDPEYGNMLHKRRIKQYITGINMMLMDCAAAIRTCNLVETIAKANLRTMEGGYQLSYTVVTKDGDEISDILDILTI